MRSKVWPMTWNAAISVLIGAEAVRSNNRSATLQDFIVLPVKFIASTTKQTGNGYR